jgi:hypothetical protein
MEVAITSTHVIVGYAYFNAMAFYPIVSTFGASLECFGGLCILTYGFGNCKHSSTMASSGLADQF